jgi:hypothetical protein
MLENASVIPKSAAINAMEFPLSGRSMLLLALGALEGVVLGQPDYQDAHESDAENDHRPIDETRERCGVECGAVHATPVREAAAAKKAHHCGAKDAAVAHSGKHSANQDGPKGPNGYCLTFHGSPLQRDSLETIPALPGTRMGFDLKNPEKSLNCVP